MARATTVDLLVCAEGIGSATRRRLLPDVAPVYAGYVAWRGMVPERSLPAATAAALDDAITYYVYANSHILVYPIPGADGSVVAGERLVNFVWYRNYLVGGDLDDVLVGSDGVRRELSLPPGAARADQVDELRSTAANRLPAVIADVVVGTEQPFVQVIFDVDVPRMAFDRVCLIGDAAFVVRPHAAAGTAKAAADAWSLAEALDRAPDVPSALRGVGAGPAGPRPQPARADPAHRCPLAGRRELAPRRPRADLRPDGARKVTERTVRAAEGGRR